MSRSVTAFAFAIYLFACVGITARDGAEVTGGNFSDPRPVAIAGYSSDVMEPFLTRDGRYLFFNNSNAEEVNTRLYWAERIDPLHFHYRGEVLGVNTPAKQVVPSMDRGGNFYFASNRSYEQSLSTLYRGRFSAGNLSDIELVPGVSLHVAGTVNFDAEISADGETLYFVESHFGPSGPKDAHILMARRTGSKFVRDEKSEQILQSVNDGGFTYAPATSASELEIFFTRLVLGKPTIYMASRGSRTARFGPAHRIDAISGFVEGPTISPDGKWLYYHKDVGGHFALYCVHRP